jgi:hypothetical protein
MQQPSANIVDAVSGDEVCPLCFDRYSAADQCTCVVCQAASCPSCAEVLDVDGALRCFACRPVPMRVHEAAAEAGTDWAPLALPRPIALSAARAGGQPALPFPLTTSPHGVRTLQPKPPGSVFIGLPPVAPALANTLASPPPDRLVARAPSQLAKPAGRAKQKLALLAQLLTASAWLATEAERLYLRLAREAQALRTRLPGYRARLAREAQALRTRLPGYRARLAREAQALHTRLAGYRARLAREAQALRTRLPGYRARLEARLRVALGLARARTHALRPVLARTRAWFELHGERIGRPLLAKATRLVSSRAKPSGVQPDPSRPIHL